MVAGLIIYALLRISTWIFLYVSSPYFITILQGHSLWRWACVFSSKKKKTTFPQLLPSFWTTLPKLNLLLWQTHKNTQGCSYEPSVYDPLRSPWTTIGASGTPELRVLLPGKTPPARLRLTSGLKQNGKHGQFLWTEAITPTLRTIFARVPYRKGYSQCHQWIKSLLEHSLLNHKECQGLPKVV